jgi:polysaccharide biosynthesis protein PelB
MERPTPPSNAATSQPRIRVISPPALLGVTALVLATLALIFPRDDLIDRLKDRRPQGDNELGATYGAAVLKSVPDPKDDSLRVAVALRQFSLAELPEARATLALAKESKDIQARREAGLLDLRILRLMIDHATPGSAEWQIASDELKELLDWISREPWQPPDLLAIAREALTQGLDDVASRFFRRHIASGAADVDAIEEAVKLELGKGRYEAAADSYFMAMSKATSVALRRAYFRKGVEMLLASNRIDVALEASNWHLGDLAKDEATLQFLATTAIAADARGRVHALRYYRLLVELTGGRADILEQAARYALSIGRYTTAADYYFAARARASSLVDQRRSFQQGVMTLQSGNLISQAFQAIDTHIGGLGDDELTLQFLVQFSLRANHQTRAQDYSRRLIGLSRSRSSHMEPAQAVVERLLIATVDYLVRSAYAQPANAKPAITLRPFNEQSYRLAYDVFIANSNFVDARAVAEAAVSAQPNNLVWRRRLIQVAEWAGDAPEALRQWKIVAARQPSIEAYEAIARLAPVLSDDEALVEAWRFIGNTRALTRTELESAVNAYEDLGRFEQAAAWLQELDTRRRRSEHLEVMAASAERAGRPDRAIATMLELEKRAGLTVAQSVTLATLYYTQGNFATAYEALARAAPKASNKDSGYWRLFGDLAWRLGNDQAAASAYRRLGADHQLEPFELVRLLRIVGEAQPNEAARLAEMAWHEKRDPDLFILAAEAHATGQNSRALARLFGSVRAEDEVKFSGNAYFYTMRSRIRFDQGLTRGAIADWRKALSLRTDDVDLRAGLIFLLVDTRSLDELRTALSAWQRASLRDRAYWPAYAAGHQALGDPRQALAYYRLGLADRANDYLWLLGYADALEDAGEGGTAWRVRRHAWNTIRAKRAKDHTLIAASEELLAYARLTLRMAPGDHAMAVIRQVLQLGSADGPNASINAGARELVLAWALSTEQSANAKAWLWTQYGRRLARPPYADIAIALAENDLDAIERLLARNADALPRYDRIEAAREARMVHLAQSLGWSSQHAYPHDDEMHARLEEDLRRTARSVIAQTTWGRFGPLRYRDEGVGFRYWLTPNLRLEPALRLSNQHMTSSADLVNVPRLDRAVWLTAGWHTRYAITTVGFARREALVDFSAARVSHTRRVDSRLTATVELGRNQFATESAALRVGGVKDEIRFAATYDFSRREYFSLGAASQRFMTQARTLAGIGHRFDAETGYRIRMDYPNLSVRLLAAHHSLSSTASTDGTAARINPDGSTPAGSFFVPRSFSYRAVGLGFGEYLRRDYSRGIRPFADVSLGHNTATGIGYAALIGIGGSVMGSDHLSAGYSRSRGGSGVNVTSEELGLRYQLYF